MRMKNLLAIHWLRRLLLSPWSWRVLRLGALGVLLAMIAWGWHHHGIPGVSVKDPLMYTNLATHLFWVWWMMGVVFIALLLGRAWCAVCPVGWLNELTSRLGLQRSLPTWLRNFVPVTLTLVILQLSVYFFTIHRYPDYTAILMALTLLLAVVVGLVFRKRAFCSLLCPAGAVMGLYARVAPFQLRVKDESVCAGCVDKECVSGGRIWSKIALGSGIFYWHGHRRDCPVELLPAELRDSAECQLCLHCARNCTNDNILLGRRSWLADLFPGGLSASEIFFFLVLLGMLTANFSKVYVDLREAIFWMPQQTAALLGWQAGGYYLLATLWVTLVLPVLLLLPGLLVLKLGSIRIGSGEPEPPTLDELKCLPAPDRRQGFWASLGLLALPCIPLVLSAHLLLALVKVNAKAAFLPFVLQDPTGVQSYLAMNVMHLVPQPGLLVPLEILKWLILLLMLTGIGVSLLAVKRVAVRLEGFFSTRVYLAAGGLVVGLIGSLYVATVIRWLFIR
jgi:hypothetical protein